MGSVADKITGIANYKGGNIVFERVVELKNKIIVKTLYDNSSYRSIITGYREIADVDKDDVYALGVTLAVLVRAMDFICNNIIDLDEEYYNSDDQPDENKNESHMAIILNKINSTYSSTNTSIEFIRMIMMFINTTATYNEVSVPIMTDGDINIEYYDNSGSCSAIIVGDIELDFDSDLVKHVCSCIFNITMPIIKQVIGKENFNDIFGYDIGKNADMKESVERFISDISY